MPQHCPTFVPTQLFAHRHLGIQIRRVLFVCSVDGAEKTRKGGVWRFSTGVSVRVNRELWWCFAEQTTLQILPEGKNEDVPHPDKTQFVPT